MRSPLPRPHAWGFLRFWRKAGPLAALTPATVLGAGLLAWPLLRLLYLSFTDWDGLETPHFIGGANYALLWNDPGVSDETRHSLWWLLVTLTVPVALGLTLALIIQAAPRYLRGPARALLLLTALLPTTVIAVIWRLLYNPLSGPLSGALEGLGLGNWAPDWLGDPTIALNSLLAPACWASFGLSLLIFSAALTTTSKAVDEAAQLDGAGSWARFRVVTLPALRGALPLASVATALCATPSYDIVNLMTGGGPGYATTTLSLDMYGRAFTSGAVGAGAALAMVQSVIGLLLAAAALLVARNEHQLSDEGTSAAQQDAAGRPLLRGLAALLLIVLTLLLLFPLLWLLFLAWRPGQHALDGTPTSPWQNIGQVWGNGLGDAFGHSLWIGLAVALGALLCAVPAAFVIARSHRRLWRISAAVLLAIGLFQPTSLLIIPLYYLMNALTLLNSPLALILPEIARTLPLVIGLLWLSIAAVPTEILAAATVDGAGEWALLRYIVLPLIAPMLAITIVWAFLSSWNEYLLPTIMLQDDTWQTIPQALAHFVGRSDTQYGLLAMGTLLAIAPLLLLYGSLYGIMSTGLRSLRQRNVSHLPERQLQWVNTLRIKASE